MENQNMENQNMEKKNKMKYVDVAVPVLFVLALIIIYFFWGCRLDLYVTVLAAVIIAITGLTTYFQYKKMKELTEKQNEQA